MTDTTFRQTTPPDEIAIIAMTGRFPGAADVQSFWDALKAGRPGISTFTDEELIDAGIDSELIRDPKFVRAHGVVEGVDEFDTDFFGIPKEEAELIDPQHRLFLAQSLRAIEQSGYNPDSFDGLIGVYAGVSTNTYLHKNIYANLQPQTPAKDLEIMVGNDKDFLTTRAAYHLNLKGPSSSVQTACSSSLVAVHLACQALSSGDCDMALAGGVTVKLPQVTGYVFEEGKMHSADGAVRAFDEAASGIVLGNGVGIVVLKPLKAALRDRDTIHAVIKSTAVNNDGAYKASYAALGRDGQIRVIRAAQTKAGIAADTISYVEAHGTGTVLGDAVEVSALTDAFRADTQKTGFCGIGSVKTNVGHLDAASGVASLIKTVLMLKHQQFLPSLNFEKPNPNIDFENSPFRVITKTAPWGRGATPRRAGVSSFGIGGTNAHLIVEEAPEIASEDDTRQFQLLSLSAKSEQALDEMMLQLHAHLQQHPQTNLADFCFTLNIGRREYDFRRTIVSAGAKGLMAALRDPGANSLVPLRRKNRNLTFLFPDCSTPHADLGLALYLEEPDFREHVDRCAARIQNLVRLDPLPTFYPGWDEVAGAKAKVPLVQTAGFVFQVALAHVWRCWGLKPDVLIGIGTGEVAAACVSGALGLDDALSLVLGYDGLDVDETTTPLSISTPTTALLSSATGEEIGEDVLADQDYWSKISQDGGRGLATLVDDPKMVLLEIGADDTLTQKVKHDSCADAFASCTAGQSPEHLLQALGWLWQCGFGVDWSAYYTDDLRKRIPLPGHPLQAQRVWLDGHKHPFGAADPVHHSTDSACDAAETPTPQKRSAVKPLSTPLETAEAFVRQLIADQSGMSAEMVDMKIGFFEHGLSSHDLLWATADVKRQISPAFLPLVFFDCPTLADLAAYLAEHYPDALSGTAEPPAEPSTSQALTANPSAKFDPFVMSDIQEAFFVGRTLGADKGSCQIYYEMDMTELDIYRLNTSWNKLVAHHDMLRAIIQPDGLQRVLCGPLSYAFKVVDLRGKAETDREDELVRVRERMSNQAYASDRWPLFEIRVTVTPTLKRVHFSIDESIVDASSVHTLLRQWHQLYEDHDSTLPDVSVSFRDHVLHTHAQKGTQQDRLDMEYWMDRLDGLAPGPQLPVGPGSAADGSPKRTRLEGSLKAQEWQALEQRLKHLNLSATALTLTVFIETLRAWSGGDALSLILTYFNRLQNPLLDRTVGPFASTTIFPSPAGDVQDLAALGALVQKQLYGDLGHSGVSGIRVLRELKRRRMVATDFSLPVVFTSLLSETGCEAQDSFFKHVSYTITRTPQVNFDCHVFQSGGALRVCWDVIKDAFAPGVIDEVFADYLAVLRHLAGAPETWNEGAWRVQGAAVEPMAQDVFELNHYADRHYEPFALTAQQQSYAFGRSSAGGGASTQLYHDIEVDNIDLAVLTDAWRKVMTVHWMLTASIHPDGTQQVPETVPAYEIATHDLRALTQNERQTHLSNIETAMVTRLCPLGEWPFFDLQVSFVDAVVSKIHLSIDMIIADAQSVQQVLEALIDFYKNPDTTPLPLQTQFSDYQLSQAEHKKTATYQQDLSYWKAKFCNIPNGPVADLRPAGVSGEPQHLEFCFDDWAVVRETAAQLDVDPSMVLLTVYSDVWAAWTQIDVFTVAVPSWHRPSLGADVARIVGDFTAMCWLVVHQRDASISDRIRETHKSISEDLSHKMVSGLHALRPLTLKRRKTDPLAFPIVFTDLLPTAPAPRPAGVRLGKSLSRTPQVLVDHASVEDGGRLHIRWDVAKGIFEPATIRAMFDDYCRILKILANDPSSWSLSDPGQIIGTFAAERAVLQSQLCRGREVARTQGAKQPLSLSTPPRETALEIHP